MNVGILCDEFNAPLKAGQEIGGTTQEELNYRIVLASLLNLPSVPFKDYSYELNYSYDASAKSYGPQVVSKDPFYSCENGALSACVTRVGKVPDAGSSCDDELSTAYDEGIYPEETE